ncbi:MAG: SRPBCC family protein [Gemmatimonadota bacterium]
MSRVFRIEQEFGLPPEAVFPFFADVANLERITPPFLRFRVLTPMPVEIREGTILDYRLRVRGVPVRWRTRIRAWEPPHRFVDEQIRGPYRRWIHEHRFEALPGGTRMVDEIDYAAPGGRAVERLFVDRDVERIFAYRARFLERQFG